MRLHAKTAAPAALFVALLSSNSIAQESYGGVRPSEWARLDLPLTSVALPYVDTTELRAQNERPAPGTPFRYGAVAYVGLSADEIGMWERLDSGDLVWRVAIQSPGAYSLSAVFSQFLLPPGGELYVHGSGDRRTLGAYVDVSANVDGSFAFEPVAGDEIVLEYFEPASAPFHATIELGTVIHDFVGVFDLLDTSGQWNGPAPEGSGSCEVDVACEPSYASEARAVVRLLSNGALCTGAMINNTSSTKTPYMITAFHCGSMNNAILYFNYQRSNCGSGTITYQTASGTSLKASNKKYDYRLTQVTGAIPAAANHYLIGWDRSGVAPSSTVCIHHPAGDVKKISFDNNAPVKESTRWHILAWESGVTEGGSSGSPLMSQSGRYFIGQLWGGASYCGYIYDDYYGRFDQAWAGVKSFLDPGNTGATTLAGYDP